MRFMCLLFILWSNLATAADGPAEAKLAAALARYDSARQKLAAYYQTDAASRAPISRATWEAWVAGEPSAAMTAADLAALAQEQQAQIAAAAARAKGATPFDLDALRGLQPDQRQTAISKFCAALPKGGMLHVHTSGTLKIPTARRILDLRNPVLPLAAIAADATTSGSGVLLYPDELARLRALGADAPFTQYSAAAQDQYLAFLEMPPGPQPFERFDAVFDFLTPAFSDNAAVAIAIDDFARRAAAEGVLYAELRLGLAASDLPAISLALERTQAATGVTVRLDRSFFRGASPAELAHELDDLKSMPPNPWVVGTDLLGNERTTPMLEGNQRLYADLLNAAPALHLGRTIHAGEIGDPRDVRDALIMGGGLAAEDASSGLRIGHGVLLAQDPVALEYARRHQVPVEINLLSNLRLAGVADIEHHPFLDYLRLGIPVSLSTDDEGVLGTDIDQECEAAVLHSDVSYSELKAMVYNSLSGAFLPAPDKAQLRSQLDAQFARFESR